jgi:hypothetical protein
MQALALQQHVRMRAPPAPWGGDKWGCDKHAGLIAETAQQLYGDLGGSYKVDVYIHRLQGASPSWLTLHVSRRPANKTGARNDDVYLCPCLQVSQLITWLRGNVPAEDGSPAVTAVVHGDFRLDNLVFDQQMQVGGDCSDPFTLG